MRGHRHQLDSDRLLNAILSDLSPTRLKKRGLRLNFPLSNCCLLLLCRLIICHSGYGIVRVKLASLAVVFAGLVFHLFVGRR